MIPKKRLGLSDHWKQKSTAFYAYEVVYIKQSFQIRICTYD